jgi:cyclic dehypoxanthinyl futalosine synthase
MGISQQQAIECFASADLIGIGMEADTVRRTLHPDGVVSYAVDRVFDASRETDSIVEEIQTAGVNSVRLVQGLVARMDFAEFEATLATLRRHFPSLRLLALSASEILAMALKAGLSTTEALIRLRAAGLDSFSGEDLQVNQESERLLEVHRTAHSVGVRSTAGMVFGAGENEEMRVAHLFAISEIQQETGGFSSFTPWSFTPGPGSDAPTAVEYLRTLAVSRMALDNIENIESNCVAQGLKMMQMGLRFGANDGGSIRLEDDPKRHANFTEEDLCRVIRDAGFRPVERDPLYQAMYLNN